MYHMLALVKQLRDMTMKHKGKTQNTRIRYRDSDRVLWICKGSIISGDVLVLTLRYVQYIALHSNSWPKGS